MKTPHAFAPVFYAGIQCDRCDLCAMYQNHPLHIQTLPGMETADADRAEARLTAEAEDLTARMRRPLDSISTKAGKMERSSPLFYGTGANPTLF